MASTAEIAEALCVGPILAADTSGLTGVFRILLTGSAQSWTIPKACDGKWMTLYVDSTDDVQFGYSLGATQNVTLNQTSAPGTGNVGAGMPLASKTRDSHIIPLGQGPVPTGQVYLNFISSSTNGGYLCGYISERLA